MDNLTPGVIWTAVLAVASAVVLLTGTGLNMRDKAVM